MDAVSAGYGSTGQGAQTGGQQGPLRLLTDEAEAWILNQLPGYAPGPNGHKDRPPYPTSGFYGVNLALHFCATISVCGIGSPRGTYYGYPNKDPRDAWHLYNGEYMWMKGLERVLGEDRFKVHA